MIAGRFGVRSMSVFGSRVRGEAEADSDLDLLVGLDAGRSLLDLVGFKLATSGTFGTPSATSRISPRLGGRIS